jgi:hypothetical protein
MKFITKYDKYGKKVANMKIPDDDFEEIDRGPGIELERKVIEAYGSAVIAPNGDVYTWKRTADKYYIIKWAWQ